MRKIILTIFTVIMYSLMIISSLVFFPLVCVVWFFTAWWDRKLKYVALGSALWASFLVWINPLWRVKITDRHKHKRNRQSIIISNHQSMIDVLFVFMLFPVGRWVSKIENFKMPLIGWNMYLNRAIPVLRGDKKSVLHMFKLVGKAIADGTSIIIYPEGTRTRTGRLRKFKTGAFDMALQFKQGIQPVVQDGAWKALPKKGFVMRGRHNIYVKVLDYIPYEDIKDMSGEEIAEMLHNVMEEGMRSLNKDYDKLPL